MQDQELQGLSLPELQTGAEPAYLVEDKDGFLARVPENRLDARAQAQGSGGLPDNLKQRLIGGLMQKLYRK